MTTHKGRLRYRDTAELIVGAVVLAFPVAITEEVWNLGVELTGWHILLIVVGSLFFAAGFVYYHYFHGNLQGHVGLLIRRVLWSYLVTLAVCALILLAIDRLDLAARPLVALKRTILAAFPAVFSATVVDSLH